METPTPTLANPFQHRKSPGRLMEGALRWAVRAGTYLILIAAACIFLTIFIKGSQTVFTTRWPFVNTAFFTEKPSTLYVFDWHGQKMELSDEQFRAFKAANHAEDIQAETYAHSAGGILPCIVGTVLLVVGAMAIALFLGVSSAIYLSEYSQDEIHAKKRSLADIDFRRWVRTAIWILGAAIIFYIQTRNGAHGIFSENPVIRGIASFIVGSAGIYICATLCATIWKLNPAGWLRLIRLAIMNLAGVPSIVFGLFGAALFVVYFKWNISLLAGWFTLALMVLPVVITSSEESLKAVPQGFREGSLALGATKWQAIRTNVLPYAIPGILTSSILGIARVAGETAPILFTAAYVVRDNYPWQVAKWTEFFFQPVQALPYHIYVVSSKIPQNEYTEKMQYGTAFVFLLIVMLISLASILLRLRLRKKLKW